MPMMPTMATDEQDLLLIYLRHQRGAAKNAAYGLTDAQASCTPTASALSVGGLIKHLTRAERGWMSDVRQEVGPIDSSTEDDYLAGFRMAPDDTLAALIADYDAACAETDATIGGIEDMDAEVPVPQGGPWLPTDIDAWSVRWVMLHLIEETARHAGHLDVVRESIDGATAGNLIAAAENWPVGGWVKPWQPAPAVA